jgi:hypothetical protein
MLQVVPVRLDLLALLMGQLTSESVSLERVGLHSGEMGAVVVLPHLHPLRLTLHLLAVLDLPTVRAGLEVLTLLQGRAWPVAQG